MQPVAPAERMQTFPQQHLGASVRAPDTGHHPAADLGRDDVRQPCAASRSEEHTSELQSLMRISYAVFCLKKKKLKKQKRKKRQIKHQNHKKQRQLNRT